MRKLFSKEIMVCGSTGTTIEDQKELENLGMRIEESIYFDNDMVVYKGRVSTINKNLKEIFEKYATVEFRQKR